MANVNSSNFTINVNRSMAGELGVNGRVQSTIVVYKGSQRLSPVSSTPTTGQFKVTISSQDGCSASIKENDTVYVNSMSSTNATITLNINVENAVNFQKNINLVKSISNEEISNIESRVSVAEQKITEDAITNVVSKKFYTKDQTNTQISSKVSTVQQTVDSWGVRISQNETDISSLKLTDEQFSVKIGGKADKSNIISMINASTEGITISSSKVNITGFVTFANLSGLGQTTINGGNITTGTIDASKATITNINASNITSGTINASQINVTNINASNITTGTLSGDRITGGTIVGTLFRTDTLGLKTGVAINKDSMQIGATSLFYDDTRFRLQCTSTFAASSMGDIYLMPGLNSNGTASGTGTVVVPEATLRTQKLTVVNNASVQGALAVSSAISCNNLSAVGAISATNGFSATNGGVYVSGSITTTGGGINATSGTITGYHLKATKNVNCAAFGCTGDASIDGTVWISKLYVNGSWVSSDKRLKTDIKYVNVDTQSISPNGLVSPNVNITTSDMHEFIETLPMVSYRLIEELNNNQDNTYYGFLIQDIMETKVGSELTEIPKDEYGNETDGYYSYSQNKFIAFICGALQKEIKQRKELEAKVLELEGKIK